MLPVELDNGFKIIAFWAMNDKKDLMQRYIGQVWMGLNKCLEQLDDKTFVIGDFKLERDLGSFKYYTIVWKIN